MSFDLHLPTTCDHKIHRELVTLDDDKQSLRVSKILASAKNVAIYASDSLIPKTMYIIISDPTSLVVNQPRMVYLKEKWRSPGDFFEITYVTLKNTCPKCAGLESIDDISYDVRGGLRKNREEKLLLQNVEKWTVTEIGSNPFHQFIGTSLVTFLGDRVTDINFLATKITQEINLTLQKFADMQNQYRLTGRAITDGETLENVENIQVAPDDDDPTILRADVTVIARSGRSVDFAQYLKIPEG